MAKKQKGIPAEILALLSDTATEEQLTELASHVREENPFMSKSQQMESTLQFIRHPMSYTAKKCLRCKETFGTTYHAVSYCSDTCRAKDFKDQTGVDWNWTGKTQVELWGGEPPRIINPTLWKNLRQLLEILSETEPDFVESDQSPSTETLEPLSETQELSDPTQQLPPGFLDHYDDSILESATTPHYQEEHPLSTPAEPAPTNHLREPGASSTLEFQTEFSSFDL